ncbi:EcsC family protein [Carnobacterium gallinarum]|uniref:EcsC family protein n=1 Tax=Carnobacterium gallinarum TaxID=2749 RepID=UPI0005532372|nr:EcsC family protein [Carnobacterium gallinarum]
MAIQAISEKKLFNLLDWAYEKVLNGTLPGMVSAEKLAQDYLAKHQTVEKSAAALIRTQNSKSMATGFATNLGGLITLPISIPANISTVILIQLQMIAAIAVMGGYDLKSDQVRSFVYLCLLGTSMTEVVKSTGVRVGNQAALAGIHKIPTATIIRLNQKVGFKLVTKFGEHGVVSLSKLVPVAGGVIGGSIDGISTNIIGKNAYRIFIADEKKVTGKKMQFFSKK